MRRGCRRGYEVGCPNQKPRMWLAEYPNSTIHFAEEKVTMKFAAAARPNQRIHDLQRVVDAQAERLRSAEQELSHTRDSVAAVTRALGVKEAEVECADLARGRLAGELELAHQELAKVTAALREKEAVNEGLLSRLGEKEGARSKAEESAQRAQQELAAVRSAMRDKDTAMERMRAEDRELLLQAQDEAAHARAQLVAACREACATAQRARELAQRINHIEKPVVTPCGSPERLPRPLPSGPAWSPETPGSSQGSTEVSSVSDSVTIALTSAGASDADREPSARSPTRARECLFTDVICHWVATFVHRDWARVCSTTAAAVYRACIERHDVWYTTAGLIGAFQSAGAAQQDEKSSRFFPEPGPIAAARQAIVALGREAVPADGPTPRACDRFVFHTRIIAHMYEELRLRHIRVFQDSCCMSVDMNAVLLTLEETLEMRAVRVAATAGGSTSPAPATATH